MKNKLWFENKQCEICKEKATQFLYFDKKNQFVICDKKECYRKIMEKMKFIGNIKLGE